MTTTYHVITFLLTTFAVVLCQNSSPCPETFVYEPRTEEDRWYGVLSLRTSEDLIGVFVHVILDRQADLLGNWFGETSTTDNTEFIIKNMKYRLEAGPPVSVRFFVKYNSAKTVPSLKTILLNGRIICSDTDSRPLGRPTPPTLHISRPVNVTNNNNGRPSTLHTSNSNNRPSSSSSSNGGGSSRPISSSGSSGGGSSRPVSSISSNGGGSSRPSSSSSSNSGSGSFSSSNGGVSSRPSSSSNSNSISGSTSSSGRPSSSGGRPSSSGGSNIRNPETHNTGAIQRPSATRPPSSSSNNNNYRPDSSEVTLSNIERETNFNNNQRPSSNQYGGDSSFFNQRPNPESANGLGQFSDEDSEDFFQGDFSNLTPSNRPSSNRHQGSQSHTPSCGTIAMRPNALVSNGQNTTPGQWPWHAALYHSKGIQLMYVCGGTLISKQYVITAAHCVTKPHTNKAVNSQYLLVYLGKYNLKTFGPEVQDRDLEDIYVHPQYNHSVYFNDIAVLKLSRPVEITNFVRPCCLWEEDNPDLNEIIEKQGTVVGWGFDENRKLSSNLMQAQMPVVSTVTCIYSNREFFSQFTFEKNFCAGFRNGTSVCNGDSGGGMVFPRRGTSGHNTIWQLRGLVSVGVALQGQGVCDTSQYIVFTDVAKYTSWIKQIMNQDSRF